MYVSVILENVNPSHSHFSYRRADGTLSETWWQRQRQTIQTVCCSNILISDSSTVTKYVQFILELRTLWRLHTCHWLHNKWQLIWRVTFPHIFDEMKSFVVRNHYITRNETSNLKNVLDSSYWRKTLLLSLRDVQIFLIYIPEILLKSGISSSRLAYINI